MAGKGKGPQRALDRKVVNKLLDKLSTDDDFRTLFQADPHAALVEAGWEPTADEAGSSDEELRSLSGSSCLAMTDGATLAPKEDITAQRTTLEQSLGSLPFSFIAAKELQAR